LAVEDAADTPVDGVEDSVGIEVTEDGMDEDIAEELEGAVCWEMLK
jgi:hypothetical protein